MLFLFYLLSFLAFVSAHLPAAAQTAAVAQPAVETPDLATISRIRDEGFSHSHVMEYSSGLFDDIGPRLTGSPEFARAAAWSIDQLKRMGAANARTESWGDFGMGWRQVGTSALLVKPNAATILAQATPWSPATNGEATADVIAVPELKDEKDFDKWKKKLAGKIILSGDAPKINPDPKNSLEHYDAARLEHLQSYPLTSNSQDAAFWEKLFEDMAFYEKVGRFFADEKAVAVLVPGGMGGGA